MQLTTKLLATPILIAVLTMSIQNIAIAQHSIGPQKRESGIELKTGRIDIKDLPSKITSYIAQNFKGYAIKQAEYDPLCGGTNAIDVAIKKQGSPNYSLIFLLDGNFVQREEDVKLHLAPAKVIAAVQKKYPTYKIASEIELLTFADKSKQFLFDITNESGTKEVTFRSDGSIVCEQ